MDNIVIRDKRKQKFNRFKVWVQMNKKKIYKSLTERQKVILQNHLRKLLTKENIQYLNEIIVLKKELFDKYEYKLPNYNSTYEYFKK